MFVSIKWILACNFSGTSLKSSLSLQTYSTTPQIPQWQDPTATGKLTTTVSKDSVNSMLNQHVENDLLPKFCRIPRHVMATPAWTSPDSRVASPPVSSRSEATWELKLLCLPQDLRQTKWSWKTVKKNFSWILTYPQHLPSSQSLQIEMDKLSCPSNRQILTQNDSFKKKCMPGMHGIYLNHQTFQRCQKNPQRVETRASLKLLRIQHDIYSLP